MVNSLFVTSAIAVGTAKKKHCAYCKIYTFSSEILSNLVS